MTYCDQLRQWAIFQWLDTGENICKCRFRRRSDADAYVSLLRREGGKFEVVFDPQPQEVKGNSNQINCDQAKTADEDCIWPDAYGHLTFLLSDKTTK